MSIMHDTPRRTKMYRSGHKQASSAPHESETHHKTQLISPSSELSLCPSSIEPFSHLLIAMFPTFQEWLTAAEADILQHPPTSAPAPPPSSTNLPVLVVGAGPAGLCAMAELGRRSVPFVGLEQHSGVGGIWDVASGHSSMYEGPDLQCQPVLDDAAAAVGYAGHV